LSTILFSYFRNELVTLTGEGGEDVERGEEVSLLGAFSGLSDFFLS